jgi:hypothetical protein
MRLVRFLSRVAFICNICFLVASFSRWLPALPDNAIISDIIVLGYLVSVLINILVNLLVLVLLLIGRLRAAAIPVWLLVVNCIFFIGQILLFYTNLHPH